MKKFLLLVLSLSVLAVLSACSDSGSSSNNGGAQAPAVTKPDTTNPNSFVGTYKVVSFETQASGFTLSNNCTPADGCLPVTIYGNNFTMQLVNGALVAESQMQMYNSVMKSLSREDVYQYIKYADMSLADLAAGMQGSTTQEFMGITGRNLTSSIDIQDAKFTFTLNDDGTISNTLTFQKNIANEPAQTITTVKLQKISDTVVTIEPNSLIVPAEQIPDIEAKNLFMDFKEDVTAQ